jgi:hypothetical protein
MREGGRAMTDELVQRDRDVQVQERRTRIRESRYNGKYEKIIKIIIIRTTKVPRKRE